MSLKRVSGFTLTKKSQKWILKTQGSIKTETVDDLYDHRGLKINNQIQLCSKIEVQRKPSVSQNTSFICTRLETGYT